METVEKALTAAVRDSEHRIHLDMEKRDYISSAELRVRSGIYKQLLSIKGAFAIRNPSTNVRTVIQMVGIGSLIATSRSRGQLPRARKVERTPPRRLNTRFSPAPTPHFILRGGRRFLPPR